MTYPLRVMVVEDHAPFRSMICKLLQRQVDVRIVGEAADGLDAIRQAEALRPDVVVLDINLPKLNGLDVAGRLRTLVPDAKLMFVTIESSLEVVEQAYSTGAHGYVYKPRALRDMVPVLDAIIRGGRFVSGGLARIAQGDSLASHCHHLLFWSDETVVVDALTRFIATGLSAGNTVIAIVPAERAECVRRSLQAADVDIDLAKREHRYVPVAISELLARATVNGGTPDPARLFRAGADIVADAGLHTGNTHARIAACGELATALWTQGHLDAAIQLEHLWDEFATASQMDVLCAYPLAVRSGSEHGRSLCAEHTVVEVR
jgi:DNA-binding NarL/FixJ family response regulator